MKRLWNSIVLLLLLLLAAHAWWGWVQPFWLPGTETIWDTPSHLAQTVACRDQGPGWPLGVNWMFYCGEQTGQFYPPLFHVLAGWLALRLPAAIAIKLLASVSVALLLPASLLLLRRLELKGAQVPVALLGMWSFLCLSRETWLRQENVGGTLQATFNTGLLPAALGLTLVIFYQAVALREVRSRSLFSTGPLLLALAILDHIAAGTFAALFGALIYLVALVHPEGPSRARLLVKGCIHVFLAAALSALWWLPFLAERGEVRVLHIPVPWRGALVGIFLVTCAFAGAVIARRPRGSAAWIYALAAILAFLALVAADQRRTQFHLYRYTLFFLLMLPPLLAACRPGPLLLGLAAVFFLAQTIQGHLLRPPIGAPPRPPLQVPLTRENPIAAGPVLVVSQAAHQGGRDAYHCLAHRWPLESHQRGLLSVIVEANPLAPFAHHLAREFEPNLPAWGFQYDASKRYERIHRALLFPGNRAERLAAGLIDDLGSLVSIPRSCSLLQAHAQPAFRRALATLGRQLAGLGIRRVITSRRAEVVFSALGWSRSARPIVAYPIDAGAALAQHQQTHHIRRVGAQWICEAWLFQAPPGPSPLVALAAPLPEGSRAELAVRFVPTARELWARSAAAFFEPGWGDELLVEGPPIDLRPHPGARIENLAIASGGREIRFEVRAPRPVPVIVRAQFSRRWHAYGAQGELPVRRVAPDFLLLLARGPVRLSHEAGAPEISARLLAAAALATWLAMALARRGRRHAGGAPQKVPRAS